MKAYYFRKIYDPLQDVGRGIIRLMGPVSDAQSVSFYISFFMINQELKSITNSLWDISQILKKILILNAIKQK